MKKISIIFALAAAALGFSSCHETWDDNPVLKTHEGVKEAAFLNNPVMQDMPIMISESNRDGSFLLTCSQPDFGYAASATYKVQVSMSEDFAKFKEISQAFFDCSQITPLNSDIASIVEEFSGVKSEADLPMPYQKVYMRLRAYIAESEDNTQYLSNAVCFNSVSADYLAIWVADVATNMYLRGGFPETGGWEAIEKYQFKTGETENTWVTGEITIPKDTEFKVADSSWGSCNWGASDGNTDIMPNTPFELNLDPANGGPKNIKLTEDFKGVAQLSMNNGIYTLVLSSSTN